MMASDIKQLGFETQAWPFQEARKLLEQRLKGSLPKKGYVVFETGYGPSGLPHIGTFGEVARTTMVRNAFERLAPEIPTRLFCFSDDMDGLRKVPDNIPNRDMVAQHMGKPLTRVPDPFGTHDSFGHHNNDLLRQFLDTFGFEYEFKSATDCYREGVFDGALLSVLQHVEEIKQVVLPTLGSERRATYSPFLPISPKTGRIQQTTVLEHRPESGTLIFVDEDGTRVEIPVTGGNCKLQWKCDWAMRWAALDVDYEMSGKDLIDSVKLSGRICRILGGKPPVNLTFELFLDEKGEKISKSKGNGISVGDWLWYAPRESLSFFMYQKPKAAKRLYFDVIPKNVDDYLTELQEFVNQDTAQQINTAIWYIHDGLPPKPEGGVSFNLLLNLVSVCHTDNPEVLWHYVTRYMPEITPETSPMMHQLIGYAIRYYKDFIRPEKYFRKATPDELKALEDLRIILTSLPANVAPEEIQTQIYEVGKRHGCFPGLRDWFQALYQILLGQDSGPRMGSFVALLGINETIELLDRAVAGEDLV